MTSSRFGKTNYVASPVTELKCVSGSSARQNGGQLAAQCNAHTDDAVAAYSNALNWYYTGNTAARDTAINILNAWSGKLQKIDFDTSTYVNGKITASWATEETTRAAEILRYTGSGWKAADIQQYENMLENVYYPLVSTGWAYTEGNWLSTMTSATIAIGVFTNNQAEYEHGISMWRGTTPAQIYMTSDGKYPLLPVGSAYKLDTPGRYWGALSFDQGMYAETCRDFGHTAMGLDSIFNGAETAYIQGIDLYGEQQARLVAGLEYMSRYINNPSAAGWPCPNPPDIAGGAGLMGDVAYNHYAALGVSMPQTKQRLINHRPLGAGLMMAWETLTHALGPL